MADEDEAIDKYKPKGEHDDGDIEGNVRKHGDYELKEG